jgi:hypothetical protein
MSEATRPRGFEEFAAVVSASEAPAVVVIDRDLARELVHYVHVLDARAIALLRDVAYLRLLRDDLAVFTVPSSVRRLSRITPRQQVALFELLRLIDQLFPGVPILRPEAAE